MVKEILRDGFEIFYWGGKVESVAVLSLRVALRSYFSTYTVQKPRIDWKTEYESMGQVRHSADYCEKSTEAIVHFQHFVELVCKSFLRKKNPLLVVQATRQHVIFDKLLSGESVSPTEYQGLYSIEFSQALERICHLIKAQRIDPRLQFILEAQSWLEQLNRLRNRQWHAGTFVLRYPALDRLFTSYILPFVQEVVALEEFSDLERFWKYQALTCGIDPLNELSRDGKVYRYNGQKIAIVKELGRAAYENPLDHSQFGRVFNHYYQRPATAAAMAVDKSEGFSKVKTCPVCGVLSLVSYQETEIDEEGNDFSFVHEIRCFCCSFSLEFGVGNPQEHDLDLESFWDWRYV